NVIGFMKGKSAIYIARNLLNRQKNFTGQSFWARGYFVSTVGLNEKTIRKYIQNQDKDDRDQDELGLFK
ncbi:MAG: transposase, partial [Lentisphaerales bacterium]|nr:transposase [Lentisphaerales bacterium]